MLNFRICCWAPCGQKISIDSCWRRVPAAGALSSKCATTTVMGHMHGRTDGRTDTRPLRRPCSAYYAGSVDKSINRCMDGINVPCRVGRTWWRSRQTRLALACRWAACAVSAARRGWRSRRRTTGSRCSDDAPCGLAAARTLPHTHARTTYSSTPKSESVSSVRVQVKV